MKKKIFTIIVCTLLLTGCKNKTADVPANAATDNQEQSVNTAVSDPDGSSIQNEIAKIEELRIANDDAGENCNTQSEMNENAAEGYKIWDDELNSLWNRLSDELGAEEKESLLIEQREWINNKDQSVKNAGLAAEGGSLQPLLESVEAANLTRVRVYYLAGILADLRGESFVISPEIQAELDSINPDVDAVFAQFEGTFYMDEEKTGYIKVAKIEDSEITTDALPGGTKWVVTFSNGPVLTDPQVINYTSDTITFDADGYYYQLRINMAGGVELGGGEDINNLYDFILSEWT